MKTLLILGLLTFAVCVKGESFSDRSIRLQWPPVTKERCSHRIKQKAMYGYMKFEPSLRVKPMTSMEVDVEWNDLQFHPENRHKRGTIYVSYPIGMKGGPGGYFGVIRDSIGVSFLFSIWDGDRTYRKDGKKYVKKSSKLTWPMDMDRCKRNCQDCALPELRDIAKQGFTTGTQCKIRHAFKGVKLGDRYTIKLRRVSKRRTIHNYFYGGGFRDVHKRVLNERNRKITGSVWEVTATVKNGVGKGTTLSIGTMMFESNEIGFSHLGTFNEMVGCYKCNEVYHKDTRYGPIIGAEDGSKRTPVSMGGKVRSDSTCKKFRITGSKEDMSISFESGAFVKNPTKGQVKLW